LEHQDQHVLYKYSYVFLSRRNTKVVTVSDSPYSVPLVFVILFAEET